MSQGSQCPDVTGRDANRRRGLPHFPRELLILLLALAAGLLLAFCANYFYPPIP